MGSAHSGSSTWRTRIPSDTPGRYHRRPEARRSDRTDPGRRYRPKTAISRTDSTHSRDQVARFDIATCDLSGRRLPRTVSARGHGGSGEVAVPTGRLAVPSVLGRCHPSRQIPVPAVARRSGRRLGRPSGRPTRVVSVTRGAAPGVERRVPLLGTELAALPVTGARPPGRRRSLSAVSRTTESLPGNVVRVGVAVGPTDSRVLARPDRRRGLR